MDDGVTCTDVGGGGGRGDVGDVGGDVDDDGDVADGDVGDGDVGDGDGW